VESVSEQLELRSVSIGHVSEERIRLDLLQEGRFDYVDMLLRYLTDLRHAAFALPYPTTFRPLVETGDAPAEAGWMLEFPNVGMGVVLTGRMHPQSVAGEMPPCLMPEGSVRQLCVSTSLLQDQLGCRLLTFEMPMWDKMLDRMSEAVRKNWAGG